MRGRRILVATGFQVEGRRGTFERSVFDGEMQNHHWHNECLKDAQDNSDCEWEFQPYDNERPKAAL
jgi:hypothetical protein